MEKATDFFFFIYIFLFVCDTLGFAKQQNKTKICVLEKLFVKFEINERTKK